MIPFFYALMWFSLGGILMRAFVMWARVKPLERQLVVLRETCDLYEAMRVTQARDRGPTADTHTSDAGVLS